MHQYKPQTTKIKMQLKICIAAILVFLVGCYGAGKQTKNCFMKTFL